MLCKKQQTETLEIILYQIEKKDKFKFFKEIKRIKYLIEELGEHEIDGIKFTLQINEDPNNNYPEHPPVIYPKRYVDNSFINNVKKSGLESGLFRQAEAV